MKVAITGGTGCLGRPLVKTLIKEEHEIRTLVVANETGTMYSWRGVEVVIGNLHSFEALDRLTKGIEIVFHLAAKVHSVPRTKAEEDEFFRTNVEGTENLLRACAKNCVRRIIYYSTVGVYGRESDFHGHESSPCRPKTVYAKSKHQAERLILDSTEKQGQEGVVLRFPIVYGALDRGNMADFIKGIRNRRFFFIGDGSAVRSMVSSENAAEAALKAAVEASAANQLFCITDGRDYSIKELVQAICQALGIEWHPLHLPFYLAEAMGALGSLGEKALGIRVPFNSATVRKLGRSLTFSCEKAQRVLGYEPKLALLDGITKEVEWLRSLHNWN